MFDSITIHYLNHPYAHPVSSAKLDNLEAVFQWPGGKKREGRFRRLIYDFVEGIGNVYIKCYDHPSIRWRSFIAGSEAYREWKNSERMRKIGLQQPEMLVVASRWRDGGITGSYLIVRKVPSSLSLAQWLNRHSDPEKIELICESLLEMIARMHSKGFCQLGSEAKKYPAVLV